MASFISSGNAIVVYLNARKTDYGDKGLFVEHVALNISVEASEYNAITKAIKEKLKIVNEEIKLIILELKGKDKLVLDCDAFLLNYKNMVNKNYYNKLNHVIIGKTGDTYDSIIGYVENVKQETLRPRATTTSAPCTTFKLKDISGTCALLPEIIKKIIFKCITDYYNENTEPAAMKAYYNPQDPKYIQEVAEETKVEADLAAAEAAAEVNPKDECDFKALLKSKIKNNESHDYCKVTDPDLLARMQQNIDENKVDVDVSGLNDLIKTRLDNSKKVKEEEEDEEKEREDGKKTISENKEANMIREANEMFMISRKVLSKGATYSSSEFFNQYLPAINMVHEQEEKEAEPAAPVVAPGTEQAAVAPKEAAPLQVAAQVAAAQVKLKNVVPRKIAKKREDNLESKKQVTASAVAQNVTEAAITAAQAAPAAPAIISEPPVAIKAPAAASVATAAITAVITDGQAISDSTGATDPAAAAAAEAATSVTAATAAAIKKLTGTTAGPATSDATAASPAPAITAAATGATLAPEAVLSVQQTPASFISIPRPKEVTPQPKLKKVVKTVIQQSIKKQPSDIFGFISKKQP